MLRSLAALVFLFAGWPSLLGSAPQDPVVLQQLRTAAAAAPLVVAHRGASEQFPENTVTALRAAAAQKAHVVEFDVWQTKDGAWVLLHDATLDRTTDAIARFGRKDVRVDQCMLAEVRGLDAGAWKGKAFAGEKVPTLAEALAAVQPAIAMVEHKGGDPVALAAELRKLDANARVLVQSFDWPWLTAFHAAAPDVLCGALGSKDCSPERLAAAAATGARLVHWDHRTLDLQAAATVRAAGHLLCAYTVDADCALLGASALGCDLITTNRPERLVALRELGELARVRPASVRATVPR